MNLYKKLTINSCLILTLGSLASCESMFYDEGDCDVTHYLTFTFDMNLDKTDKFVEDVHSVRVYAFDTDGKLVWQTADNSADLDAPGYKIKLDLAPGTYQMVVWGGVDNNVDDESFYVPVLTEGVSTLDDLHCLLNGDLDGDGMQSSKELYALFQGNRNVTIDDPHDGSVIYHDMPLIKDTNLIRVVVVNNSSLDITGNDLDFQLTADNNHMYYDNSIIKDGVFSYYPFSVTPGTVNIETPTRTSVELSGIIGDIYTARILSEEEDDDMKLAVTYGNNANNRLAYIDMPKVISNYKSYFEDSYGYTMTQQELLDRGDEWVIVLTITDDIVNPSNPDNPDYPAIPENPDTPDNPDNPDNPNNPDDPDNPEVPSIPDIPEIPETPEIPNVKVSIQIIPTGWKVTFSEDFEIQW